MGSPTRVAVRYPLIDLLKAFAAQCIVLHHFSAYGPVSDAAYQAAPALISALYEYGRMAVQVFLVVAGYLAARGLSAADKSPITPPVAIVNRFLRLLGPYLVAVALAIVCAALARPWLSDEFVPAAPTVPQLLAHAGLLHGVLGYDALSSGLWYVAIDFQLFALLTVLLWVGGGATGLSKCLVAVLCAASLLWFNRDASLDNWAIYFIGSYGLGALAQWSNARPTPARQGKTEAREFSNVSRANAGVLLFGLVLVAGVWALVLDFRLRLALAMLVAVALAGWADKAQVQWPALAKRIPWLSQTSYALFLVHFSVLLLTNALYSALGLTSPGMALAFMALGWAVSLGTAAVFHHVVERPMTRWRWGYRD